MPAADFARSTVIVIDSREQLPYDFGPMVRTRIGALPSGDYSIDGHENEIAIERKSLSDYFGCVGADRDRFQRELERLSDLAFGAIVIEANYSDLRRGPRSWKPGTRGLHPSAAVGSTLAWSVRYRIPVYFAGSRIEGAEVTYKLLRAFWKYDLVRDQEEIPAPAAGGNHP